MAGQSHTAGPRAKVRVHLTNPESGYESETEATVSVSDWTVIDAVLCGRGQTYAAAPDLLEAAVLAEDIIDDFLGHLSPEEQIACSEDPKASAALKALRAAIAKATGEGAQ